MADHCTCPKDMWYTQADICDFCVNVAFFDDPDYGTMMGFVLVDNKWIIEQEVEA